MPFLTPDVGGEHDALAVFARQQLLQIATTLQGLDRDQLAARPTVSSLSLGDLARHAHAVVIGIASTITDASAGSATAAADAAAGDGIENLQDGDTADSLIAELHAAADQLAAAIRAGDLDAPVPVPDAPWFTGEERWTVRWIALHSIEEVARHAGHADILRESIDAKGAYELNALADGEQWPPPGW